MNWFRLFAQPWRPWGKFVTLFCLCLVLAIACTRPPSPSGSGGSPTAGSGSGDGRVTIGTTQKPRTLDPADAYELRSINLIYNMSDRLYTYTPGSTEIKPQLATALPKVSADGLTYTIPLRSGVVFHDGTPFDAAAMAFSLKRFAENKGKPSFLLSDLVASIEATSKEELTIKLKKPFAAFPSLLAFGGTGAVSPKAYELGAGKFKPDTFVGTGPYKLGKYSPDSVRLEVFDKYWGEKPTNKGINWQIYTNNPGNLFNAFKTKSVDVAYISLKPEQVRNLEDGAKKGNWQAISSQGSAISYIVLNRRQKPLDNPVVRQAIAAFVNRTLLNERVLYNQAEPLYSTIPNTFDVSLPVFKDQYGDGNIDKAKQLLQQAGFSAANPVKLQVWYPSASPTRSVTANVLKEYAQKEMGGMLQFEPSNVEGATFFKDITRGVYPVALLDWYPDFLDPDNFVQPFLECPKGSDANGCEQGGSQTQGSFYYSAKMNQLIDAERKEQNPEARRKIFADIQNLIAQDVPLVPLWQSKDFAFAQTGVSGVAIDPTQILPYSTMKK
ncbi:MAG: ABC transporter substrate-binding protein [Cyanosarcina radialis HA8281-LM2]|jgi:peptide/nickel transport system substrate-binding protein|nr:ABC transporter substrate-binding protein [Cyanosarcina radialis HA8281-LM2]